MEAPVIENLVDEMIWLVYDTAEFYEKMPTHKDIKDFLRDKVMPRIGQLKEAAQKLQNDHYTISLIGLTNVGKSTLAEALLDAKVAPSMNGPATSFPIEYRHGEEWKIILRGLNPREETYESAEALGEALAVLCLGLSAQEAEKVSRAVIQGPMPRLEHGLVLADTPGFGSASTTEKDAAAIQQRLKQFVTDNIDEIFFCVDGSNFQVKKDEVEFFKVPEIKEKCRTVLIMKWGEDDENENDEKKYRERYQKLFDYIPFQFIGTRQNLGIDALKQIISNCSNASLREERLKKQIKQVWESINFISQEDFHKEIQWLKYRQDSFYALCKKMGVKIETN